MDREPRLWQRSLWPHAPIVQDGEWSGAEDHSLMSPGSLSGKECQPLLQGEGLAAITALNPQIRELGWGLYGFLRISTLTLF